LRSILSVQEHDRLARFRSEHLRTAYAIRRGVLRCILGRYLGIDPRSVKFTTGLTGKPRLERELDLEFSVASSEEFALLAVTRSCPLGVDIERIRSFEEMEDTIDSQFSTMEAIEMRSLDPVDREMAFFSCWTRKEAYLKAIGEGLLASMKDFQVTVLPGSPAKIVTIGGAAEPAEAWTLHDLELLPQYACALAYCDLPRNLVFRTIDLEQLVDAI